MYKELDDIIAQIPTAIYEADESAQHPSMSDLEQSDDAAEEVAAALFSHQPHSAPQLSDLRPSHPKPHSLHGQFQSQGSSVAQSLPAHHLQLGTLYPTMLESQTSETNSSLSELDFSDFNDGNSITRREGIPSLSSDVAHRDVRMDEVKEYIEVRHYHYQLKLCFTFPLCFRENR